ncbi:MAG TPA: DUF302 domain-containing protein [bacterium]|nr:DUF302 domain-containing protein [bacterium]
MKNVTVVVVYIFGLITGILATGFLINISAETVLLKEMASPYDFEKTVEVLAKRINSTKNWHVTAVIDQAAEVKGHGEGDIGKLKIVQYCSGKYAYEVLADDNRKKISVMMPKTFSVYEKNDGRVYIAVMNGSFVGKIFKGETYEILEKVSLEVEALLNFINFKFSLF